MTAALDLETRPHDEALARERLVALADATAAQCAADSTCPRLPASWLGAHIADSDGHLLALRWFNPFGPTHLEFVLKRVPGRAQSLLVANQCHPFSPETWVLGCLASEQCDTPAKLVAVFQALAAREAASADALVQGSPTTLLLSRYQYLDGAAFFAIVQALCHALDAADLAQAVAYMDRFPGRPWDRTAAERDEVFTRFASHLSVRTVPPAPARHTPVPEALFAAWWLRVTNEAHVRAELAEFPRAWEGAIRFRRGEFSQRSDTESGDDGLL